MIEKNRDIAEFFYEYIKIHNYFRVKSVSNQFKESLGLIPELTYLSEREYQINKRNVGQIIGNILRCLILNGFMKKKETKGSYAYRITNLMILGMKQFLNDSKIQEKRITNPFYLKIGNRIFCLRISCFEWNFFLNCYYPKVSCILEIKKIDKRYIFHG